MTLAEFILAHPMGYTVEPLRKPGLFRCRLTCEDRGMTFAYLAPPPPSLAAALLRLAAGARQHVRTKLDTNLSANRDVASFKHWAVLYGYDPESEADRKRYLTLRRRAEQLKYVIGIEAYNQLLEVSRGSGEADQKVQAV